MMFKKYQHIERFGNMEVHGIENGLCHAFYKIDGTNSSIWFEDGEIKAGSRNRELSLDKDNAGFYKWVLEQKNIKKLFKFHPELRLYGEWLVPHSLRTYREDAWRNFYVFDILNQDDKYIDYEQYAGFLNAFDIDLIPPICTISNPTENSLINLLDKSGEFLIKDGAGKGEGIVIKRYDYINKFGRTVWAKIVTNEFKQKNKKEFGIPEIKPKQEIEKKIIEKLLTEEFINKEYSKIESIDGWSSKMIPKLLNVVFYEFVKDETWNMIKQFKNPTIDFGRLKGEVVKKIRTVRQDLF